MRLGAPLTEVGGGMAGTLEVFHAGAWGSVCADAFFPSQGNNSFDEARLAVRIPQPSI